ncbi:MAG: phosphopantetheine adenylyltransferase [Pseudomonadota bacterium]
MKVTISILLLIVGVIHLLPVIGVLGTERLIALYGIPISDPNLEVLMRHRAVLFALLGGFLVYAAFTPALQMLAVIAGLVSVVSFIALAQPVDSINAALLRVVRADLVALVSLVIAGGLLLRLPR